MKRLKLIPLLTAVCLLLAGCGGETQKITVATVEDSSDSVMYKAADGFAEVLQNDSYTLLLNGATAEIALRENASGTVFYSNPQDRSTDTVAAGEYRSLLDSQLALEYSDSSDSFSTLYSADDAVAMEQYHFTVTDTELAVLYEFGERTHTYLAPRALEVETMEHILSQLDDDGRDTLESVYTYLDASELDDEYVRQQVLEAFPILDEKPMYIIANYTSEVSEFVQEMIEEVLLQTDYDLEQMQADAERLGLSDAAGEEKPAFNITLRYTLTEDGLCATVKAEDIVYNTDAFRLTSLKVLPAFGAVRRGTADAYAVLPDGSGALLYADSRKSGTFCKPVYGENLSLEQTEMLPETTVRLPVFGFKQGQSALLAEITSGDAMAELYADGSGQNDSYLKAYAAFDCIPYVHPEYSALNIWTINSYQKRACVADMTLQYSILTGSAADYVGMANAYRTRHAADASPAEIDGLVLDMLGTVEYPDSVAGVQVRKKAVLTTYDQAAEIVAAVKKKTGVLPYVILEGATGDGIYTDAAKSPKAVSALGGKSALQQLITLCENGLALSGSILYTTEKRGKNVATTLNGNTAYAYRYRLSDHTKTELWEDYYLVSPRLYEKYTAVYQKGLDRLGLTDSALLDCGDVLNSDFANDGLCDRTEAEALVQKALAACAKTGTVTVSGGNAYALAAAGLVVEAPIATARSYCFDETIPFYAIATRGMVTVTGAALNNTASRQTLLQAIETGSNLFVRWMYADNSVLKKTYFDGDSYCYTAWLDTVCDSYNEWKTAVGDCANQAVAAHRNITDKLTATTFENGKTVYVNYGSTAQTVDGITVAANSWQTTMGGE